MPCLVGPTYVCPIADLETMQLTMALCAPCLPQAPVVLTIMTFVLGGIQQLSMQQLSEVSLIRTSLPVPSLSLPMVSGPLSVHTAVHTLCIGIGRPLFGQEGIIPGLIQILLSVTDRSWITWSDADACIETWDYITISCITHS